MSTVRIDVTPEQQELLTNLIIEERTTLRAIRQDLEDEEEVEANDEAYDDLGDLLAEVTGHLTDDSE